jgi:hypothetical protein
MGSSTEPHIGQSPSGSRDPGCILRGSGIPQLRKRPDGWQASSGSRDPGISGTGTSARPQPDLSQASAIDQPGLGCVGVKPGAAGVGCVGVTPRARGAHGRNAAGVGRVGVKPRVWGAWV